MADTDVTRRNKLLAALPEDEYGHLSAHLERVQLSPGETLYESGRPLQYVYFPTTAIVSLLYIMENGAAAEIAMVGNEGMVGIALVMGADAMPNRAMALCAGTAYRLKSQLLMNQFNRIGGRRSGTLQHLLLVHPGVDYPDVPERRLQSASFDRTTTVPMAAGLPRSLAFKSADHDPRVDREYPRGSSRRHHGHCWSVAA